MLRKLLCPVLGLLGLAHCSDDSSGGSGANEPLDPATAERAVIDRFSAAAGTLMVRDETNGLPSAGDAIDFDQAPFITNGLGPQGELVSYYNFDVQPTAPAPIFVFFHAGEAEPIPDQLNIVDDVPGDDDYNDFWQVTRVEVPDDYVANTVTSLDGIEAAGFAMTPMDAVVNCPIVPEDSTATKRENSDDDGLHQGWFRDQAIFYFNFAERELVVDGDGEVAQSPIYVTFNINPDEKGGGPPSGFVVESGTSQTHNVVATLPINAEYSPLWSVNMYDNADFDAVMDLASAEAATILVENAADVNCPIVTIQ